MKKKFNLSNIREKILVSIFIIFIVGPTIIYNMIPEEDKINSENRVLKEKPNLSTDNIMMYPEEYEEYYDDNIPFKSKFVEIYSELKYRFLGMSVVDTVIPGKDGWLFYNSRPNKDQDTLADYQGTNKYTSEQINNITNELLKKKNFLEEQGIELHVLIVPNKSQIYYEYMPDDYYKNEGASRADELVKHIKENTDINIVYPKDKFLELKDEYQLYSKLDSHWTSLGSYIAYVELMKSIDSDFEYKELNELEIVATDIKSGDLATMMNMDNKLNDKSYKITNNKPEITAGIIEDKGPAMNRFQSTNMNGKKIMIYRDSFGKQLINHITKEFREVAMLWAVPFSEEQILDEDPDVVVIEVAERYLENLIK